MGDCGHDNYASVGKKFRQAFAERRQGFGVDVVDDDKRLARRCAIGVDGGACVGVSVDARGKGRGNGFEGVELSLPDAVNPQPRAARRRQRTRCRNAVVGADLENFGGVEVVDDAKNHLCIFPRNDSRVLYALPGYERACVGVGAVDGVVAVVGESLFEHAQHEAKGKRRMDAEAFAFAQSAQRGGISFEPLIVHRVFVRRI